MANLTEIDRNCANADMVLAVVKRLAETPREALAAEALEVSNRAKSLFDERYSTSNLTRHAEIVAELERTERELSLYQAALVENIRNTYGVSVYDLISLIS